VTTNQTVNPAGTPIIKTAAGDKPYTREDYVRDLKKVSTSSQPSKDDEQES
jgi:hypothetical protein